MTIKGSGRVAWILAAGLLVCFAGPSQAAAADTTAASSKPDSADGTLIVSRHIAHQSKKYAHRRSGTVASKASDDAKSAPADQAADDADKLSAIPATVANANAALPDANTPAGYAAAMTARASDNLQADAPPAADTQVVAADQLNDVDRALHEANPPAPTMALASAEPPATPAAPVTASTNESSTWDQTSLIGKIFIGFGALLTMASAARMFMA
jgi:hypothetical protein